MATQQVDMIDWVHWAVLGDARFLEKLREVHEMMPDTVLSVDTVVTVFEQYLVTHQGHIKLVAAMHQPAALWLEWKNIPVSNYTPEKYWEWQNDRKDWPRGRGS